MMNRLTVSGLRLRPSSTNVASAALLPSSLLHKQLLVRRRSLPYSDYSSSPTASFACENRRGYATHHYQHQAESRRRAVTPFSDDGRVPWTELSVGEKTARAAQQTFNFGLVVLGLVLTVRSSSLKKSISRQEEEQMEGKKRKKQKREYRKGKLY